MELRRGMVVATTYQGDDFIGEIISDEYEGRFGIREVGGFLCINSPKEKIRKL